MINRAGTHRGAREKGFTLIELMIALTLGILVVAGVIGVFLSNKRTYTTNNSLAQVQDNTRVAFELLARDAREAGLTGCGNPGRIANVLNNGPNGASAKLWYANYADAVQGYDGGTDDPAVTSGTGVGQRIKTASSIEIVGADGAGYSIASNDSAGAKMTLNESTSALSAGDLFVVCDPDHAAVAQVTTYTAASGGTAANFAYAKDTTTVPGNCSIGLGFPTVCSTAGNPYAYQANAMVAKLYVADWYVGTNGVGGKSLYRGAMVNGGGTLTLTAQEMVRNVTDLQISYHVTGGTSFGTAAAVTDWTTVDAISVQLKLQSAEQITGSNAQPLIRTVTTTITLRNRV